MGAAMRYQPQGRVQINWSNPVTRGLVFAYALENQAVGFGEDGRSLIPYLSSTGSVRGVGIATPAGLAMQTVPGTGFVFSATQKSVTTNAYSLFAVGTAPPGSNTTQSAIDDDDGGSRKFQFRVNSGRAEFIPFTSSGNGDIISSVALTSAELARGFAIGATANGTAAAVYQNGAKTAATLPSVVLIPNSTIAIGGRKTNVVQEWTSGGLTLVAMWNRALSDEEMRLLSANPWQLFDAGSSNSSYQSALIASVQAANSILGASGSSSGAATTSATANALFQVSGYSAGTATTGATTVSITQTSGSSTGSSVGAAGGVTIATTNGSSVNVASLNGAGAAVWQVSGNSAGIALVYGSSSNTSSIVSTNGSATGTSSTAGYASLIYQAVANALGSGSANGSGALISAVVGNTAGNGQCSATGAAIAQSNGAAAGTSSTQTAVVVIVQAHGFSPNRADVAAISQYVQQAIGQSTGKATVSGVTEGGVHYTAVGDKFALKLILSQYKIELNKLPYNISLN